MERVFATKLVIQTGSFAYDIAATLWWTDISQFYRDFAAC
jgi:hypothetical protein